MPYPNREEILKILPAIEKIATKKPSIRILNNNAAPIDRWKYQIVVNIWVQGKVTGHSHSRQKNNS